MQIFLLRLLGLALGLNAATGGRHIQAGQQHNLRELRREHH
jgi:hypothetical protein